jgi:hypothetical protein
MAVALPLVYAKIHDKVAACDKDLGYKIRPLMPAALRAPVKPALRLSSFTPEKLGAANCEGLKAFASKWPEEVEYVRERRAAAGDAPTCQSSPARRTGEPKRLPARAFQPARSRCCSSNWGRFFR